MQRRPPGLEDRAVFEAELREAGFTDIRVEAVTHGLAVESVDQFWRDMVEGTAPITLMKHHASQAEWSMTEERALKGFASRCPDCRPHCPRPPDLAVARKG